MSEIYRVRPDGLRAVEEIEEHYLWFSRPTSFGDENDADVFSFLKNNESIGQALERIFEGATDIIAQSALIGICCFTGEVPASKDMGYYPGARRGIVVEYDKAVLEAHFLQQNQIGDCFKAVAYSAQPTLFSSSNDNDVLWEDDGNLKTYKPINQIGMDQSLMDKLFLKMFTQITDKYQDQREFRVILAGRNIPDRSVNLVGYKIIIPKEAIKKIYVHKQCNIEVKEKLNAMSYPVVELT